MTRGEVIMVIGIIGESCVGKSTLADVLKEKISAELFTGKDYLSIAKNESIAKKLFEKKLQEAASSSSNIIYVISEKEHLSLLPENAVRILITAELDTIKERFAQRMYGKLPAPVAQMLERKHGSFDSERYDIHMVSERDNIDEICQQVSDLLA